MSATPDRRHGHTVGDDQAGDVGGDRPRGPDPFVPRSDTAVRSALVGVHARSGRRWLSSVPSHRTVTRLAASSGLISDTAVATRRCARRQAVLVFASQLGALERVIGEAVERSNTGRQFDQPIGAFRAVSHRLAEMQARHESARLQLYRAAAMIGDGRRATMAAAVAKLVASEAIAANALDAARIHGARGYVVDFEVEREVRDALGGLVYSGTSDVQRNLIARLMGVSG